MQHFIYGYHSIEETLKKGIKDGSLFFSNNKGKRGYLVELAKRKGIEVKQVPEEELDTYCDKKKHRGILLVYHQVREYLKQDLKSYRSVFEKENALVLLLDSVTDPHNYGAIVRSSDQFHVDLIILPSRKSVKDTAVVAKTSAGAITYVNQLIIPNLIHAINFLKDSGFWIYGADINGEPVNKVDLKGKVALVMGSEGQGIRNLVKKECDMCLSIPCRGHIDSLNVSVAAGIILYEIRRQQHFPG